MKREWTTSGNEIMTGFIDVWRYIVVKYIAWDSREQVVKIFFLAFVWMLLYV
jgi:hypothetical protein